MKRVDHTRFYRRIQESFLSGIPGSGIITENLGNLFLPAPPDEVIARVYHGFWLRLAPKAIPGIERTLYYTGVYEKGTLHILRHILQPGDLFVDIGANIGLMTIYGALLTGPEGKVIAFEANPDTRRILEENIALNDLKNIEVSPLAIGSAPGEGTIYLRTNLERGTASLIPMPGSEASHRVQVIRLDQYDGLSHTAIRAIKIDIEGYELEALKGAGEILSVPGAPILILECSALRENLNSTTADIFTFLQSVNRYRIFRQKKGKERISPLVEITSPYHLPKHDNIYCFPESSLKNASREIFS